MARLRTDYLVLVLRQAPIVRAILYLGMRLVDMDIQAEREGRSVGPRRSDDIKERQALRHMCSDVDLKPRNDWEELQLRKAYKMSSRAIDGDPKRGHKRALSK